MLTKDMVKRNKPTHISKLLNILGPCCTKHQCLSIRTNLTDDLADLRLETHIQHTISFIHDQVRYAAQVRPLGLKHINQPTRSSDHNFNTPLQVANLRTLRSTTINGSVANTGIRTRDPTLVNDYSNVDGRVMHTQTWYIPAGSERRALAWAQG